MDAESDEFPPPPLLSPPPPPSPLQTFLSNAPSLGSAASTRSSGRSLSPSSASSLLHADIRPSPSLGPPSVMQRVMAIQQSAPRSSSPASLVGFLVPSSAESLLRELDQTLNHWTVHLKHFLTDRDFDRYNRLKVHIDALTADKNVLMRKKALSHDEFLQLKNAVEARIREGDSMLPQSSFQLADMDLNLSNTLAVLDKCQKMSSETAFTAHRHRTSSAQRVSIVLDDASKPLKSTLQQASNAGHMSLYFHFKACIASLCGPGETSELSFALYNQTEAKFVSENYVVSLTFNGMPKEEEKIGQLCTLFVDLNKRDLNSRLYLVCRIVRVGRMMLNDREQQRPMDEATELISHQLVKRPFGFAVLDVSAIINAETDDLDTDHLMRVYTATSEMNFSSLFEHIIQSTGNYETSSRAETMCVSIRLYCGDPDTLPIAHPSLPLSVTKTPRLGFPEVILPGDSRHQLYVTLLQGDFHQGRKTSAKNVEVTVSLRRSDGSIIRSAVSCGSGTSLVSEYESIVYYHCNTPKWNETVRVDVPVGGGEHDRDMDKGTHLFFTFRHCSTNEKSDKSEKAFAFGILKLVQDDDTVIQDAVQEIVVYRFDKRVCHPDVYVPALLGDITDSERDAMLASNKIQVSKETFSIRTQFCSTKLTQNLALLKLLRWRNLPLHDLRTVLKDFTFIGPLEIIKFVQDILDALFAIMQSHIGHDVFPKLVFSALVFIMNIIISDRRFTNFRPILDVYIQDHYGRHEDIRYIWVQILEALHELTSHPTDLTLGKELRGALKAWEYLFKFVVKSFERCEKDEELIRSVRDKITSLLDNLIQNGLVSCDSESSAAALIGTQILVFQNVHTGIHELTTLGIFSYSELSEMTTKFIRAIPLGKKKIIEAKLQMCSWLSRGPLMTSVESCRILLSAVCDLVRQNLDVWSDESILIMCANVVGDILRNVPKEDGQTDTNVLDTHGVVVGLVPILLDIYLDTTAASSSNTKMKNQVAVLVVSIFSMMSEKAVIDFFVNLTAGQLDDVLMDLLKFLQRILKEAPVQDDFFEFHISYYRQILKLLSCISNVLQQIHLVTMNQTERESVSGLLSVDMWMETINTLVLIMQAYTTLLRLSNSVVFPDISSAVAYLFQSTWYAIRPYSSSFIPRLVGPCIELTMHQGFEEVQEVALEVLVEMIDVDRRRKSRDSQRSSQDIHSDRSSRFIRSYNLSSGSESQKLSAVEVECIDQMDRLIMSERKGDDRFKVWFLKSLQEKLTHCESCDFVQSLDRFLSLALSVRQAGMTPDLRGGSSAMSPNIDARMAENCADDLSLLLSHLLHFTALLDRTQIYVKYIHYLANLHLQQEFLVEAGWAIKLHADLLSWNFSEEVSGIDSDISLDLLRQALFGQAEKEAAVNSSTNKKDKRASHVEILEGLLRPKDLDALRHPQSSFKRKELLYLIIIHLFTTGSNYEHAIALAEALSTQYARTLFNYKRVSKIHRVLAQLSEKLASCERYFPEYFRVGFYGFGWNKLSDGMVNVCGKQFVYCGRPWEKLSEFSERILAQYPGSQLVKKSAWPPDASIMESEECYLQICKVEAEPDKVRFYEYFDLQAKAIIPDNLKAWYENYDTSRFTFSRPFRKPKLIPRTSVSSNEFMDLWTENFTLRVEFAFPYFLRRSEVVEVVRREYSPIENAVRNIEAKNRELESLERTFRKLLQESEASRGRPTSAAVSSTSSTGKRNNILMSIKSTSSHSTPPPNSSINVNPLTMSLNGAVDAPVNGGVPMYRRAFLKPEYLDENPNDGEIVRRLRQAIDDQVIVIRACIDVHERVAPVELRPLHETLVQFFLKNFAEEIARLNVSVSTVSF